MTTHRVTTLIITHRRAQTLPYVLEGLMRQSYKDFEVVVVAKEPDDAVRGLLDSYKKDLDLRVIVQSKGYAPEAFDMGLEAARGQIVAFLDDDAVPGPNWLEEHVKTYDGHDEIGGVAGIDIPVEIARDGNLTRLPEIPVSSTRLRAAWLKHRYVSRPLSHMSDWLTFFGRDGLAHHSPRYLIKEEMKSASPSLLFLGANMSIRREAVKGVRLSEKPTVTSFLFEQHLSYPILKRGYRILYDPRPEVLHIVHDESLGRFFQRPASAAIRDAEYILSFYTLKPSEPEISWMYYITELIMLIISRFLGARKYGFKISIYRIYGLLYGFTIGALEDRASARNSLTRLFQQSPLGR